MKRLVFLSILCFVIGAFLSGPGYAGWAPGTGIKGTSHDLTRAGGKGSIYNNDDALDRLCVFCHAPHHTYRPDVNGGGLDYYPLWNHDITTQNYTPYDNGLMAAIGDQSHQFNGQDTWGTGQPGGVSRLCLSCHDGTVAVNAYGNFAYSLTRGAGDKYINAANNRFWIGEGGDLRNHHPIGFDYADVASKDDEIAPPSAPMGTTGYTISQLLWNGKMECTTCHDVHNTKNQGEKFTWVQDINSQFCFQCHLK